MAGNKKDIYIPAVFISKAAGDVLLQYVNDSYAECWILPSYESIAWLLMLVSFISLIVITGIFALCFLIRQQRSNQRSRRSKEPSIISYEIVKSLPSVIYCSTNNANQSYDTCAICLEDYVDGTVLRILPCNHGFHGSCIDSWLMNWRGFCPICKQDVVKAISSTENAPLLLPNDSQQSTAQVCLPLTQETCEEACGIPINIAASDPDSEPCQFHFSQPLLRLSSSPARAPRRTRHLSWISLTDPNSVEAFRASPYFTPPSFFRSSAPNVLCHQVP
ncbi:hypothetical protein KP509_09G061700 [Ceratopteris richardii]|nr:hypothetical protein KP509_09G061700 [Ceratopteris richardii]